MTTKPTTIDGRQVLWHSVVDDNRYPGEVAVVPGAFGDVTVYGKYGSRWIPNSGSRAAVRMLLAEVELLKAVIDRMDRKQRHGCYDANCKECDR